MPERCNVLHRNIRLERTFSYYGCDGASTTVALTGSFRTRCALVTPHAQRERGKVIGVGVHMFICLWTKKNLNRILAIDSPFQTYTVGLLIEFID